MPILDPERQENGSLTGVKQAGEGAHAVNAAPSSPGAATTAAFGEGAVDAARADEAARGTKGFAGWASMSTWGSGGGVPPPPGTGKGPWGIADLAKPFVGSPSKWGATGPSGFDCAGVTQYGMTQFGINLPWISHQQ